MYNITMSIKTKKHKEKKVVKPKQKTKTDVQKNPIVDKEKSEAQNMIATIQKESTAFKASWNGFENIFKETMELVTKLQKMQDETKEEMIQRRNKLVDKLKEILPTIKVRLGKDASKNKIAYVIAINMEGIMGGSISAIRRLLERYEEKYGALFPQALEDKSKDIDTAEGSQNHLDVVYQLFGKGKDELLALVTEIKDAIEQDNFDRLIINLNASKSKIKGFHLVVKNIQQTNSAA